MTFIVGQRGFTGWGFQIGRLYWYIAYPKFWKCGYFGEVGWDHG